MYSKKIAAMKKRDQAGLSKSVMDLSTLGEALPEFSRKKSCLMVIPINACEENVDFVFLCLYSCKSCQRRQSLEHLFHLHHTLIRMNTHVSLSPSKTVVLNIPYAVNI